MREGRKLTYDKKALMAINKAKLENEIKQIIAIISEKEEVEIASDAHFVEDLDMDSMMALEVLAALEKKFQIVIAEDQLPKVTSINKVLELVIDNLGRKGGAK